MYIYDLVLVIAIWSEEKQFLLECILFYKHLYMIKE